MDRKPITLTDVKQRIKKCKKKGVRYDWLGFVENKDLTPEVTALFISPNGMMYDWVNGNNKLWQLEKETE
jgi:hypothetical protein